MHMYPEDLLTVDELAILLRLHCDTVRRMLRQGRLPGVRIGKRWYSYRRDVEALLMTASAVGHNEPVYLPAHGGAIPH